MQKGKMIIVQRPKEYWWELSNLYSPIVDCVEWTLSPIHHSADVLVLVGVGV